MERIRVRLEHDVDDSYDILIGNNLFPLITNGLRKLNLGSVGIITDTNVRKLYGQNLLTMLRNIGIPSILVSFQPGEKSKTRRTKERIEDALMENKFQRDSVLLALGGGVAGDITGYVASTYMRGIPYLQIPTTLLAMVDSSIGGKTGVDTPHGKNMIGTFYQPKGVYMDMGTLKSLSKQELINGSAEMIKHAIIAEPSYFIFLSDFIGKILDLDQFLLPKAIALSITIKRKIVQEDEKEASSRKKLNFGHTIGHAIERASDFAIPHGTAVALGMIAETKIAKDLGLLNAIDSGKILGLIGKLGELPSVRKMSNEILAATYHDKKNISGKVRYVLPARIGVAKTDVEVEEKAVRKALGELP